MKVDTWFFLNTQTSKQILQPEFKMPRTHLGIFLEDDKISYPIDISFSVYKNDCTVVRDKLIISCTEEVNEKFEVKYEDSYLQILYFCDDITEYPDKVETTVKGQTGEFVYSQLCEYHNICGQITDFDGNPFPAVVCFYRHGFDGYISVWSDINGNYSVKVPAGRYNAVFCDDNSYNKTTLENWCWNMHVDRDEQHDLKVGNGEVYSLTLWTVNGGLPLLMFYFRPMMLGDIVEKSLGDRKLLGWNFNLSKDCITVYIDGEKVKNYGLQRIFENSEKISMPAYIVQTEKPKIKTGKHTAIVEFKTYLNTNEIAVEVKNVNHLIKTSAIDDFIICEAQARVQFYYTDGVGTHIV